MLLLNALRKNHYLCLPSLCRLRAILGSPQLVAASLLFCLHHYVAIFPLLRAPVIRFRACPNLVWVHLNSLHFAKTLFPNKIIFWGSGGQEFFFWGGKIVEKRHFLKLYEILAWITKKNLIFDSREVNSVIGEKFKFVILLSFLSRESFSKLKNDSSDVHMFSCTILVVESLASL